MLTDASLTAFLQANRSLLVQFSADPLRFAQANFELTRAAQAFVAALTPEDVVKVREAVGRAVSASVPLRFQGSASFLDRRQHVAVERPAPGIATRSVSGPAGSTPGPVAAVTAALAGCD